MMTYAEKLALLEKMAATGEPEWVAELANFKRWGSSFPPPETYAAASERLADLLDQEGGPNRT